MKVLSIKEPYATLIKENKKLIETRSWKTSYRGELFIHASNSKINNNLNNNELNKLIKNIKINPSHIICKCNLVDCIYMSQEYIENVKKNNYQEYICGEYKEGRYAWILDNIIPLDKPIKAKGQLNIWNYYDEYEIFNLIENINYGWIDKNNNKYYDVNDLFSDNYILQSPKELINNKLGVCWDQVELERYYFRCLDYDIKTYFIVHYDNDKCPTHTFLTYKKDNSYYWFEHAWEKFRGIHKYDSLNDMLVDIKNLFIKNELNNNYNENNLVIYEYNKPKPHLNTLSFYKHCENGKTINL